MPEVRSVLDGEDLGSRMIEEISLTGGPLQKYPSGRESARGSTLQVSKGPMFPFPFEG